MESPFDRFPVEYDSWFDLEGKLTFDIEVLALSRALEHLPEPWIEIGVGSGRFAEALGIPTGIEPSEKMKEMAEQRGINVIVGRGEEKLVPDGSFGTAFIIVTICFVDNPRRVLDRASEMLSGSGRVALGLITSESPWALYYLKKKEEGHPFYGVATFFEYREILSMLEEAGLAHERTVSTLFQAPGRVEAMERPRNGYYPEAGFTVVVAGKRPELEDVTG